MTNDRIMTAEDVKNLALLRQKQQTLPEFGKWIAELVKLERKEAADIMREAERQRVCVFKEQRDEYMSKLARIGELVHELNTPKA